MLTAAIREPKNQAEVLEEVHASVASIESYLAQPTIGVYPKHVPKNLVAKGYYFEDSDDIVFTSQELLFEKISLNKRVDLGMDLGRFSIKDKTNKNINGLTYGVSLYYKHLIFRIGNNQYNTFSEIVPSLSYVDRYKKHSYQFKYIYENALFYTYRPCVVEKRIKAHHFELSDYVTLNDNNSLWASIALNRFSNKDREVTAQFDWVFFYDRLHESHFSYDLALEGWYTTHSKTSDCFYSPKFTDATLVRFEPDYKFSDLLNMKAIFGVGYSFRETTTPYKLGIVLSGTPYENFLYEMKCLYNNSVRSTNNSTYKYFECNFMLGYSW